MTEGSGRKSRVNAAGRDEGDLAPFFAAGRAARPVPGMRLLEAVLADATAEAQPSRRRGWPAQPSRRWRWPAVAVLAASVAAGFLIGLTGIIQTGGGSLLAADGAFEMVGAIDTDAAGFFDLAWEG